MAYLIRQVCRDLTMALVVLSLVFLSFGHQPIAVADDGTATAGSKYAALSWCGGVPGDHGGSDHSGPCHACRAGIADLPPPPCAAEAAFADLRLAAFIPRDPFVVKATALRQAHPRAPPLSI